jgi:ribonucleoside-diphosphate reductase alpha chain
MATMIISAKSFYNLLILDLLVLLGKCLRFGLQNARVSIFIPIESIDDPNGEIGICILSALNLLELHSDEDIAKACKMAVRTLESVIDYQDYPVLSGENFTKNRRSLGIGITNFAGYLAKQKLKYDDQQALTHVHELMEKIQWN